MPKISRTKAPSARSKVSLPKAGVVVVGSLNMDLVIKTETMPEPGQTVLGQDLHYVPGGKGANQAAAAGKVARPAPRRTACRMVGRVGDDAFGERMLAALQTANVDTSSVLKTKAVPSGVALILVDRHGENSIVVAPGANHRLTAADLLTLRRAIEQSVVLALQLEVPFETAACAIALAKQSGTLTILDPAPAPPEGLPESLFHVDILSPNQTEAHLLTGISVRSVDDARRAGEKLISRGTRTAVIKMGGAGAVIVARDAAGVIRAQHVPGFRVPVVDTTAAGDCFTGALATALAEGTPLPDAVRFANAAGALACTKLGAQSSIPTRQEVEELLRQASTTPGPIAITHNT